MKKLPILAAAAALVATASVAYAIVTFNPADGTGFVGKGDVQLVYGWNNQALQANEAIVQFRATSESITDWSCTRNVPPAPEKTQERERTTTTQGLVSSTARKNSSGINGPVTGFNLLAYNGPSTVSTEGPAVGSCPANPSGYVYNNDAVTTQGAVVVQVSIDGATWFDLL